MVFFLNFNPVTILDPPLLIFKLTQDWMQTSIMGKISDGWTMRPLVCLQVIVLFDLINFFKLFQHFMQSAILIKLKQDKTVAQVFTSKLLTSHDGQSSINKNFH